MAIGNLHRMTPEERDKALGKEIADKVKPKEPEVPKETKPEKKRKF